MLNASLIVYRYQQLILVLCFIVHVYVNIFHHYSFLGGGGCINIILHDTLYLSSFYFIFYLAFRIIWHNTFSSVWTYINLVCYNYCIMMRVGPSSITYQPLQTINDRIFACKWNVAYFIHVYKYDSKFIHTIK